MGQIVVQSQQSIILTDVDRLVARNADGGLSPLASHIILLGEAAGRNLGALSNIIALGGFALDGGLTDPAGSGTIAIGGNALSALTNAAAAPFTGPNLAVGLNAGAALEVGGGNVLLGPNVLPIFGAAGHQANGFTAIGASVLVDNVFAANSARCTLIGYRVLANTQNLGISNNVIIGAQAAENVAGAGGNVFNGVTAIGAFCLNTVSTPGGVQGGVFIGFGCAVNKAFGGSEVLIGEGIVSTQSTNTVCIGANIVVNDANSPVMIGDNITGARGNGSIIIGARAGTGEPVPTQANTLIIENNTVGVRSCALYSDMRLGNLILGNSTPTVDRDMVGTNTTKLLNGTIGGVNPVGGGYFYVNAGALHWVGSAGTDTLIAPA